MCTTLGVWLYTLAIDLIIARLFKIFLITLESSHKNLMTKYVLF